MKASRRGAIEPREDPRREVGRAVLAADELHTRTKTTVPETLTARETALEQAQDPRPPTARTQKKLQLPPLGNRRSDNATLNATSSNLTVVIFVSAVISAKARKRDTLTLGKSSIAVRIAEN